MDPKSKAFPCWRDGGGAERGAGSGKQLCCLRGFSAAVSPPEEAAGLWQGAEGPAMAGRGRGRPQAPPQPLPPATPHPRARAALPWRGRRVGACAASRWGGPGYTCVSGCEARDGAAQRTTGPLCACAVAKVGEEGARPRASFAGSSALIGRCFLRRLPD